MPTPNVTIITEEEHTYVTMSGLSGRVPVRPARVETLRRAEPVFTTQDERVAVSQRLALIRRGLLDPLMSVPRDPVSLLPLFRETYERALSELTLKRNRAYVLGAQQAQRFLSEQGYLISSREAQEVTRSLMTNAFEVTALQRVFNRAYADTSREMLRDNSEASLRRAYRYLIANDYERRNHACLFRGLRRIERSETNRALHEVRYGLYQRAGVEACRWLLGSQHKDYGGREVCEVLASSVGAGASANGYTLEGTYLLSEAPRLPHANCGCVIEPL